MKYSFRAIVAVLLFGPAVTFAAVSKTETFPPPGDESENYETEVIAENLDNPSGLVLRPATDGPRVVFFLESGAGRVMRFAVDKPAEVREVLTGLETQTLDEPRAVRVGPWSLGFVTPTKLAVLGGVRKDDGEQVAVYVVPSDDTPLTADKLDHTAVLSGNAEEGAATFPGSAFGETTAYFASGRAESGGTIFKASLIANRIDLPQPLMTGRGDDDLRWPTGLCLNPTAKMEFLVAAFMGEMLGARDSRVAFIIPSNGNVALELVPGLFDVVGLAYSPSGQLYAIDLAWQNEKAGGVYRLDDARHEGRPACRAVKIANVARPTSLVINGAGTMYVTSLGSGTNAERGTITRIRGEF